jgi:hypothetical protein
MTLTAKQVGAVVYVYWSGHQTALLNGVLVRTDAATVTIRFDGKLYRFDAYAKIVSIERDHS